MGTAANISLALPLLKEDLCLLLHLLLPQIPPLKKILVARERQQRHLSSHH